MRGGGGTAPSMGPHPVRIERRCLHISSRLREGGSTFVNTCMTHASRYVKSRRGVAYQQTGMQYATSRPWYSLSSVRLYIIYSSTLTFRSPMQLLLVTF